MLTMIFVNDLAEAGPIVPDWLVHYSDRHATGSGLTFVDLVFPAFIFILGMSLPFSLGAQLQRGVALGRILRAIGLRTLSLLLLGVLMVNESPDATKLGWSAGLWSTLLYLAALGSFCAIAPAGKDGSASERFWRSLSLAVRGFGLVTLIFLAFTFVGADGHRIITLSPFTLRHEWWGILGLLGWAYLVSALVYLVFRTRRPALFGSMVLLLGLYSADQAGAFNRLWLAQQVNIGGTLGSQAAIAVGGLLIASILITPDMTAVRSRIKFTLLFIAGCAVGAWLFAGPYGISKNEFGPAVG